MTKTTRNDRSSEPSCRLLPSMPEAFDDLRMSVDRFCLLAGLESLNEMMSADAEALCGSRHARSGERKGHRWGTTRSEIAYHGGKVKVERPRVRDFAGREMSLPSWELLSEPELLQAWAMNLMVINVSTRKYARAVRLPDDAGGDLPAATGDATSKSAVSRRFVALTRSKLKAWLASPLDDLDLVVLQIDGLHVGDHLMVAAIGIDHPPLALLDDALTQCAEGIVGRPSAPEAVRARQEARLVNRLQQHQDRPLRHLVFERRNAERTLRAVRLRDVVVAHRRCAVHIGALPGARDPDAFLFPRYAEGRGAYSLATCWRAVCADAKLGRLRLHDLRHTAASQAVMSGENLPLVGKLLGHRRHRTTGGYAHLADAHLVEAVEKVGAIIASAMKGPDELQAAPRH